MAFVDRADIKALIGPPPLAARYEILRSGVLELIRVGLVHAGPDAAPAERGLTVPPGETTPAGPAPSVLPSAEEMGISGTGSGSGAWAGAGSGAWAGAGAGLVEVARACEGASGRLLRKLPFLAYSSRAGAMGSVCLADFLAMLRAAARREWEDRSRLESQ